MKRKTSILVIFALAFWCFSLVSTQKAFAQHRLTVAILEEIWVHPDTLLPIDVANVTGSAEATSAIITEIETDLPDSTLMATYLSRLKETLHDIDSINNEFGSVTAEEVNSKLVTKTQNAILLLITAKEKLKAELQASVSELQEHFLRIEYLSGTWDATIKHGRENNMPPSLLDRSNQVLSEVLIFKERLDNRADTVIFYSDQLLGGSNILEDLKSKTEEYEQLFELKYLGKTHAAIWEKDTIARDTIGFLAAISEVKETYRDGIFEFYSVRKIRVYLLLGIFILMLITAFVINRNLVKRKIETEDQRILTFLKIFRKPFAIALMLTLFIFLVIYPDVSVAIGDLVSFIILIPLFVISVLALKRRWLPLLIVLTSLFLFEEVVETLRYESFPLPRYLLLGVMILSFIYIIAEILKRRKEFRYVQRSKIRFIDVALWVSLVIVLASLIANIVGYVPLGFFLFRGIIISAIAGLLISVVVTVIDGLFTLLIMGGSSHMYDRIGEYGDKLVGRIINVVKLIAFIYWSGIVLRRFMIYDDVIDWLTGILETKWEINEMIISVEGILLFGLIIFLAFWFSRFLRLVLNKEVFPRVKMSRGLPGIISLMVRVTIITAGIILSLGALGINLDKLTILMGALGVGIGFGLQDIINNLISGFILVFERPIQAGDTVKFGDREGIVKEIGIRASIITTYDGTEVIVPNGKLISNELVNLTLSDEMVRIELDFGTDYDSEPQEIIDILVMQAKLHPDVLKNPEPFAIFFGYGDFTLNFRLYVYTRLVQSRLRIRSELNLAIGPAFKEAGIKIPFPIQDISVKLEEGKPKDKK